MKEHDKLMKNIWVVAYDSSIRLITTDKTKAKAFLKKRQKEYPALPWKLMRVEEYGERCYSQGVNDNY